MMSLPIETIQKLREITGAGVMECQKAFKDSGGDFDETVKLIRERGLAKIEKRAARETCAGLIESYIHNERIGVLLNLRAETDFVVRSQPFRQLAHELAMHIAASAPASIEELLKQPYIRDESRIVKDLIKETSVRVGENIKVNSFHRMEI